MSEGLFDFDSDVLPTAAVAPPPDETVTCQCGATTRAKCAAVIHGIYGGRCLGQPVPATVAAPVPPPAEPPPPPPEPFEPPLAPETAPERKPLEAPQDMPPRERVERLGTSMGKSEVALDGQPLNGTPFDAPMTDLFGESVKPSFRNILSARFLQPPFSVLSAREGEWQERKRRWIKMGIKSELGRGQVQSSLGSARRAQLAAPGGSSMPAMGKSYVDGQRIVGDGRGKPVPAANALRSHLDGYRNAEAEKAAGEPEAEVESWVTSSVFDPVLCELMYKWFSPPDALILDPFAGGSVRGIVAAAMGRRYVGIELRPEQVEANRKQVDILGEVEDGRPVWIEGDSREVLDHDAVRGEYDFIMSCPPYGDLEVYSDHPQDISNMSDAKFLESYRDIILKSCKLLKPNRFACFVVGDYRNDKGHLTNFPGRTVEAFQAAGLHFYNDINLVTVVGSLPVRVTKQFHAGRKVGRTHQVALIFCKGDGKLAAQACGPLELLGTVE